MKNDIGHFYDVESVLDLNHFVELFLVLLAVKNHDFIAELPTDYKSVIEVIMNAQNSWGIKFSKIIEISEYYECQSNWEEELSNALQEFISSRNKQCIYNFRFDYLEIPFTKKEIDLILKNYDKESIEAMSHFVDLVDSFSINRPYDLVKKEAERDVKRKLIRTSENTWSKSWE